MLPRGTATALRQGTFLLKNGRVQSSSTSITSFGIPKRDSSITRVERYSSRAFSKSSISLRDQDDLQRLKISSSSVSVDPSSSESVRDSLSSTYSTSQDPQSSKSSASPTAAAASSSTSSPSLSSSSSSSSSPPPTASSSSSSPPPTASSSSIKWTSTPSPYLTPEEAESKRVEEQNQDQPPPLSKALGVLEPPSKDTKEESWRETMLDPAKRIENRRDLVKQVATGYYHDYNQLRRHGGKSYMAPTTLIKEELALYMPNIQGTSIGTKMKTHTSELCKDHVSIVAFSTFRSSEDHINSFVRPSLVDMKDEESFRYVFLNLQENRLRSLIVSMFISSLRRSVPEKFQPTYLLSKDSLAKLREPLGMTNQHVGYVFLVDWNNKIRWAGCAWATVEEEESLRKACHVLIRRLRSIEGEKSSSS